MALRSANNSFEEWIPSRIRLLEAQDFEHEGTRNRSAGFRGPAEPDGRPRTARDPLPLLALKSLETINRSLIHPLELGLKRAVQKSYPPVNGLYLLLRATGLALIDANLKKPRLKLDSQLMESWRSLNAAERYFALLKAWWGRATEDIIGERGSWGGEILAKTLAFIERFPKAGTLMVKAPQDVETLRYHPGLHNLALLEALRLVRHSTRVAR